jgi:hypothetical protein
MMGNTARHFAITGLRGGQINHVQPGSKRALLGQQAFTGTGTTKNKFFHGRYCGRMCGHVATGIIGVDSKLRNTVTSFLNSVAGPPL